MRCSSRQVSSIASRVSLRLILPDNIYTLNDFELAHALVVLPLEQHAG